MKRKWEGISKRDFSKGLVISDDPKAKRTAENVFFDNADGVQKVLSAKGKQLLINLNLGSGITLLNTFEYIKKNGEHVLITQSSDFKIHYSIDLETFIELVPQNSAEEDISFTAECSYDIFEDMLWITNGVEDVVIFDGTNSWVLDGTTYSTGTFPPNITGTYPTPDVPKGKYILHSYDRIFIANTADNSSEERFSRYYDDDGNDINAYHSDAWLAENQISIAPEDGQSIQAHAVFQGTIVVFKDRSKYVIDGDSPSNFTVQFVDNFGTVMGKTVKVLRNNLIFVSDEGVYSYYNRTTTKVSDTLDGFFKNLVFGDNNSHKIHISDTSEFLKTSQDEDVLDFSTGAIKNKKIYLEDTDMVADPLPKPLIVKDGILVIPEYDLWDIDWQDVLDEVVVSNDYKKQFEINSYGQLQLKTPRTTDSIIDIDNTDKDILLHVWSNFGTEYEGSCKYGLNHIGGNENTYDYLGNNFNTAYYAQLVPDASSVSDIFRWSHRYHITLPFTEGVLIRPENIRFPRIICSTDYDYRGGMAASIFVGVRLIDLDDNELEIFSQTFSRIDNIWTGKSSYVDTTNWSISKSAEDYDDWYANSGKPFKAIKVIVSVVGDITKHFPLTLVWKNDDSSVLITDGNYNYGKIPINLYGTLYPSGLFALKTYLTKFGDAKLYDSNNVEVLNNNILLENIGSSATVTFNGFLEIGSLTEEYDVNTSGIFQELIFKYFHQAPSEESGNSLFYYQKIHTSNLDAFGKLHIFKEKIGTAATRNYPKVAIATSSTDSQPAIENFTSYEIDDNGNIDLSGLTYASYLWIRIEIVPEYFKNDEDDNFYSILSYATLSAYAMLRGIWISDVYQGYPYDNLFKMIYSDFTKYTGDIKIYYRTGDGDLSAVAWIETSGNANINKENKNIQFKIVLSASEWADNMPLLYSIGVYYGIESGIQSQFFAFIYEDKYLLVLCDSAISLVNNTIFVLNINGQWTKLTDHNINGLCWYYDELFACSSTNSELYKMFKVFNNLGAAINSVIETESLNFNYPDNEKRLRHIYINVLAGTLRYIGLICTTDNGKSIKLVVEIVSNVNDTLNARVGIPSGFQGKEFKLKFYSEWLDQEMIINGFEIYYDILPRRNLPNSINTEENFKILSILNLPKYAKIGYILYNEQYENGKMEYMGNGYWKTYSDCKWNTEPATNDFKIYSPSYGYNKTTTKNMIYSDGEWSELIGD